MKTYLIFSTNEVYAWCKTSKYHIPCDWITESNILLISEDVLLTIKLKFEHSLIATVLIEDIDLLRIATYDSNGKSLGMYLLLYSGCTEISFTEYMSEYK